MEGGGEKTQDMKRGKDVEESGAECQRRERGTPRRNKEGSEWKSLEGESTLNTTAPPPERECLVHLIVG